LSRKGTRNIINPDLNQSVIDQIGLEMSSFIANMDLPYPTDTTLND